YKEKLISLTKKGKAGADEIKQMMADLRANAPQTLGGITVKEIRDYENSEAHVLATGVKTSIDLPKSNVLQFITVDGDVISARPSGTEPKMKVYCSVKERLTDASAYETVSATLEEKVKKIMANIVKD